MKCNCNNFGHESRNVLVYLRNHQLSSSVFPSTLVDGVSQTKWIHLNFESLHSNHSYIIASLQIWSMIQLRIRIYESAEITFLQSDHIYLFPFCCRRRLCRQVVQYSGNTRNCKDSLNHFFDHLK